MIPHRSEDPAPRPEQLAAYADGELDAAARDRVEAWLAEHPEAEAELAALRQLDRLWQAAAPPEPGEADWASVRARIETALPAARAAQQAQRYRTAAWAMGALTAAAGLLLALVLARRPAPEPPALPTEPARVAAQAYPVLTDDEVEIISIEAADAPVLVVGEPPVREPLVLASPGDVVLLSVRPEEDDLDLGVHMHDPPHAPMIVAPLGPEPARDR